MTDPCPLVLKSSGAALFLLGGRPVDEIVHELQDWVDGPDRGSLEAVLTFDGLAVAALTGVIGNAAYNAFPAAARWLESLRSGRGEVSEADVVATAMDCLKRTQPDLGSWSVDILERRSDGTWHLDVVATDPPRRFLVEVSRTGSVICVHRHV